MKHSDEQNEQHFRTETGKNTKIFLRSTSELCSLSCRCIYFVPESAEGINEFRVTAYSLNGETLYLLCQKICINRITNVLNVDTHYFFK